MIRIRHGGAAVVLAGLLTVGLSAPSSAQAGKAAAAGGQAQVDAISNAVLDRLVQISDMHWHKGEYNHIVNLYRMVAVGQPDNIDAYSNAGWLLWSMDRDAEAVALYEQGLKSNPKTYYMYDELGYFYYNRKKDYPKAIAYYEKAAKYKDCPALTLHMLAHSYERNNQLDKALAVWKRAAAIPRNAPAKVNLERVQRLIQQRDGGKS